MPAATHSGRVSIAIRLSAVDADRHMARAWSPQACITAPPVVLGTVTVTQPSREWRYRPGSVTAQAVTALNATTVAIPQTIRTIRARRPIGASERDAVPRVPTIP